MDTWNKYKKKKFNTDLKNVSISKQICYGNFLLASIIWRIINNRSVKHLINKFFDNASLVLQATLVQKGFDNKDLYDIYAYIDGITKDLIDNVNSAEDYALMLGNISEFEDANYTFTELIAFVRAIAAKI